MNNRIRYNVDEVQRNTFYQFPTFLLSDEFSNLNSDAKILYMLLKNRHELSIKNNWIDENGDIYFIFTRKEIMGTLKVSDKTATKTINNLKQYNLIEEIRQGVNKPNKIYLLSVANADVYRTRKFYDSGHGNFTIQDTEILRPIKTYNNNTDFNNNNTEKDLVVVKKQEKLLKQDIKEIILKDFDIKLDVKTVNNIIKILKENKKNFNYFLEKIELTKSSNVDDLIAFLISAMKNDYKKSKPVKKKNTFNNYTAARKYDYEKLEQLEKQRLLNRVKNK